MKKTFLILFLLSLVVIGCTDSKNNKNHLAKIEKLELSIDSLNNILIKDKAAQKNQIIPFLTFQDNNAENAIKFYVELFDNSKIINLKRWGKKGPVEEGRIMHATFSLNGKQFMCSDSPPIHDWGFTPAFSNYIECENESQLEKLFSKLSENGKIMMPLDNYGFSQKFGFVEDQFRVSWQLNLK
jgi:predicted 3-demethylubiquinone-9 3-methyltransferase (glyoxalase superfamily)